MAILRIRIDGGGGGGVLVGLMVLTVEDKYLANKETMRARDSDQLFM